MPGLFLSFEGIDFSGKSEQCRRLFERLLERGYDNVEFLREPGGVPIAEAIREIVLDGRNSGLNERTELLLYSAARAQITGERIKPALASGRIVIADRYVDSTLAYQGVGRQLDLDLVRAVSRFATWALLPDRTFLLDVPVQAAAERQRVLGRSGDRIEREAADFHERVRESYLDMARREPERFVVLDGTPSAEAVSAEIWSILRRQFGLKL